MCAKSTRRIRIISIFARLAQAVFRAPRLSLAQAIFPNLPFTIPEKTPHFDEENPPQFKQEIPPQAKQEDPPQVDEETLSRAKQNDPLQVKHENPPQSNSKIPPLMFSGPSQIPPAILWKPYLPLALDLLISSLKCSLHHSRPDPQHHPEPNPQHHPEPDSQHLPEPAIHHIFSEDICSQFTLDQGYAFVKLYWLVCVFDKKSLAEAPLSEQLELCHDMYSLAFESKPEALLLMLWNAELNAIHLEEAVVR
ncbi:hypothetical protein AOQ84DRAFT_374015 [Glonium stellatum]|uniref:Uncharacterized protein n=1 Tax=Glonium stellatum TaxID=574774 RepID=A0A8E2F6M7_9PEZI|nr:hypothetical protein AOQ84DRAFT_374015 [Glonium stellatum]